MLKSKTAFDCQEHVLMISYLLALCSMKCVQYFTFTCFTKLYILITYNHKSSLLFILCAFLEVIWMMSFSVDRCSEGIEDENTQEGQAAGLLYTHTHTNMHIGKVGHLWETFIHTVASILNKSFQASITRVSSAYIFLAIVTTSPLPL